MIVLPIRCLPSCYLGMAFSTHGINMVFMSKEEKQKVDEAISILSGRPCMCVNILSCHLNITFLLGSCNETTSTRLSGTSNSVASGAGVSNSVPDTPSTSSTSSSMVPSRQFFTTKAYTIEY